MSFHAKCHLKATNYKWSLQVKFSLKSLQQEVKFLTGIRKQNTYNSPQTVHDSQKLQFSHFIFIQNFIIPNTQLTLHSAVIYKHCKIHCLESYFFKLKT